jgi:hypothetical protein
MQLTSCWLRLRTRYETFLRFRHVFWHSLGNVGATFMPKTAIRMHGGYTIPVQQATERKEQKNP